MLLILLFVQGSIARGWRGAIVFFVILGVVSFAFEATSIATGFPFGFFTHHTPGPRPLKVPIAVLLGYSVYGWLAWVLTKAMLGPLAVHNRLYLLAAPIAGSFVLVGYDYPWDAIGATILHTHSYRTPSGLFGVPLSNFLGWLLTGWAAFQLVALAERKWPEAPLAKTRSYLLVSPVIWAGLGLSYVLRWWSAPAGMTSVAGRTFVIADIYEASAAIALPAMLLPAIVAVIMIYAGTVGGDSPHRRHLDGAAAKGRECA
ncbi:carotenoid biosynthesis protein [Novosphingobium malaysiense]|uniref:carotenoid biosynthesis protein n=1 Tax=Novosphingobium malaysiense TaxID=1348853 RepID=UPI0018CF6393|nr:carotenoid biosynthesis protein [Novosphingobium malaysiense]